MPTLLRNAFGMEDLEMAVANALPVGVAAGGLAHDPELLQMLERAAGLKARGSLESNVQSPKSGRKEKD